MFGLGRRKLKPPIKDMEFENQIRHELGFLFRDFQAKVVSNKYYPDTRGIAAVVLESGNLLISVERDLDDIIVRIAPKHAPEEWDELEFGLMTLAMGDTIPKRPNFWTLRGLAQLLEPAFGQLEDAYSIENYPATKEKLQRIHAIPWSEWQRINNP